MKGRLFFGIIFPFALTVYVNYLPFLPFLKTNFVTSSHYVSRNVTRMSSSWTTKMQYGLRSFCKSQLLSWNTHKDFNQLDWYRNYGFYSPGDKGQFHQIPQNVEAAIFGIRVMQLVENLTEHLAAVWPKRMVTYRPSGWLWNQISWFRCFYMSDFNCGWKEVRVTTMKSDTPYKLFWSHAVMHCIRVHVDSN